MKPLLLTAIAVATLCGSASADTFPAKCEPSSLVAAIAAANAHTGPDAVSLAPGCVYSFSAPDNSWYGPNALPPIASDITIAGHGATIGRAPSASPFRLFFVGADPDAAETLHYTSPGPGQLTLHDVILRGGSARGGGSLGGGGGAGMGGAIFSQGTVVLERTTLTGNTARGGTGNDPTASDGGGGIGSSSSAGVGGGFGPGAFPGPAGGGLGGTAGSDGGGGGGAGFATGEDGTASTFSAPGAGGGPVTGTGGGGGGAAVVGRPGDGAGGGGGGGFGLDGGDFGHGGTCCSTQFRGAGGGGGVGGGGGPGALTAGNEPMGGGGGGFGGGGGGGWSGGGSGGFGGGGGAGAGTTPGGGAGFGGGTGTPTAAGGGAGLGGAIFTMQGHLTIRDSTLAGNSATGGADTVPDHAKGIGGAVFDLNGEVTTTDSTFAANTANFDGTSIYALDWDAATERTTALTLRGTIVDGTVTVAKFASLFVGPNRGLARADLTQRDLVRSVAVRDQATVAGAPSHADPLLGALRSNGGLTPTIAPAATSPAIDAGGAFGLATDQRGLPRRVDVPGRANSGDAADIGAVELQLPKPPASTHTAAHFGARTLVTLRLAHKRVHRRGPLAVRVTNGNAFAVAGRLSGRGLKARRFRVKAHAHVTVRLRVTHRLHRHVRVRARVTDPAGHARTVTRTLAPRLRR